MICDKFLINVHPTNEQNYMVEKYCSDFYGPMFLAELHSS